MSLDLSPPLKFPALHPALDRAQRLAPWVMLATLFAAALVQRHLVFGSSDVTWLITADEKMLDGHPLYSEVLETNPPIAPLAYLPAVLIGRALGIAAEQVTDGLVFLAAAVSLGAAVAMLRGSAAARTVNGWPMVLLAFAVLVILPGQTFGQREHIALIAIVPGLAAASLRAHGERPPLWAWAVAGLGCAVTLAFKPYFAAAVGAGPVVAALRQRSLRVLLAPENFIAAVALLAYAVCSALLFPAYFTDVLPLVRDVYLKLHHSFAEMLTSAPSAPMYIFYAALITAWLFGRGHRGIQANLAILASAAFGFALAYVAQRKGWPYQAYPMLAVTMLAVGAALLRRPDATGSPPRAGLLVHVAFGLQFLAALLWFNHVLEIREVVGPVGKLVPHPKLLALSGDPGFGHPLVRMLGGTWVSRQQALWVHLYADYLKRQGGLSADELARIDAQVARERANLIADFKRQPPDVIIVDTDTDNWRLWVDGDDEMIALLAPYRRVASIDGVADILQRVD
jgi:hypothetical protein